MRFADWISRLGAMFWPSSGVAHPSDIVPWRFRREQVLRRGGSSHWYRVALVACAAFQVAHLFALPLVISPDGLDYLRLAHRFGAPHFFAGWIFLRMPLYPFLLRVSLDAFGTNAFAALLPGTLAGFLGIWVLASEVRRATGDPHAAAVIAVLTAYPVLVSYQHAVLTETGTFFVLASTVALLLRVQREGPRLPTIALLSFVLACGYLYRATTLAVVPAAASVVLIAVLKHNGTATWSRATARAVAATLLVCVLPFAAWRAWNADGRAAQVRHAFGVAVLLYSAQQGILPATDPLVTSVSQRYEAELRAARPLSLAPVSDDVLQVLLKHADQGTETFRRLVFARPWAYVASAAQTAIVFAGAGPSSDNRLFASNVLSLSFPASKCICPAERRGEFAPFARAGHRTPIQILLKVLNPVYRPLVFMGSLLLFAAVCVGVKRLDGRLLAIGVVPAVYAVAHVLLAFGLDRFALPIFPIALAALCVVPGWIANPIPAPSHASAWSNPTRRCFIA